MVMYISNLHVQKAFLSKRSSVLFHFIACMGTRGVQMSSYFIQVACLFALFHYDTLETCAAGVRHFVLSLALI
jgi:hypothetical protein